MLANTRSPARTAACFMAGLGVFLGAAAGIVLMSGDGAKVAYSIREFEPLTSPPVAPKAAQVPNGLKVAGSTQELEPLTTGSIALKPAPGTVAPQPDNRAGRPEPQSARLTELDHHRLAALIGGGSGPVASGKSAALGGAAHEKRTVSARQHTNSGVSPVPSTKQSGRGERIAAR